MLFGAQRAMHHGQCKFEPIRCPFSCAILPLFSECLFTTNSMDTLLDHVEKHHRFDIFKNNDNVFQFQLDDITDGSGHYRIVLQSQKPKMECLLIGFKSQNGSIVLFCRSLTNDAKGTPYRIVSSFVADDGTANEGTHSGTTSSANCSTIHSLQWKSKMLSVADEVGYEFKKGLVLKLSAEKVKLWQNQSARGNETVPLTVAVGDVSDDVLQTYL